MKVVGHTLEGRPLYVAKLGSGRVRMWIQGRIHGNEPYGNDAGWKTAAIFFENRGAIGQKSRGYLIRQNIVVLRALVDTIARGELSSVNEERWDEIPGRSTRMPGSGGWPNEWIDDEPDKPGADPGAGTAHYRMIAGDDECKKNCPDASEANGVPDPPGAFVLYQNVPNPFNPSTEIHYDVPGMSGRVTLRIYNVTGRLVRVLVDGLQSPGEKTVTWDGRDDRGNLVTTGVYFYRLDAPGFTAARKMLLLK